jgi:hypothetical protein
LIEPSRIKPSYERVEPTDEFLTHGPTLDEYHTFAILEGWKYTFSNSVPQILWMNSIMQINTWICRLSILFLVLQLELLANIQWQDLTLQLGLLAKISVLKYYWATRQKHYWATSWVRWLRFCMSIYIGNRRYIVDKYTPSGLVKEDVLDKIWVKHWDINHE